MTGTLSVMDTKGDTKLVWDSDKPVEVAAARRLFDSLKGDRYLAYSVKGKDGSRGEVMRDFDPKAEAIIMAPPMVGG